MDALDRTIVIHPGSRWLRIGLASQVAPTSIPNVIARKRRGPRQAHDVNAALVTQSATAPAPAGSAGQVPPSGPSTSNITAARRTTRAAEDAEARGGEETPWDSDDPDADPDGKADADADPLTAKITSIRGDLRARMRIYKLRGQGNGNSQAATYNATVRPEAMGEDFGGDFDWTTGEADVWTGLSASR